jgi:hypothetical protein
LIFFHTKTLTISTAFPHGNSSCVRKETKSTNDCDSLKKREST